MMKLRKNTYLFALSIFMLSVLTFAACDNFNEVLPECRLYVKFKYDYNMKSIDAFPTDVRKIELYVYDADGKFLFTQAEEGEILASGHYVMEVPLPVGKYKFLAWAGVCDTYEATACTRGSSSIEEIQLKLRRDETTTIAKELEALWYGEIIDVEFDGKNSKTETINLIKDTNKVRFVFQGATPEWTVNVDDYDYEIIEANGYLNYDNSLLPDDELSYRSYYHEQTNPTLAITELNTMRLIADRESRFIVTHKNSGKQVLNINMTDFLLKTKMEGRNWSEQEYLDRQDEFHIVFIFSNPSTDDKWLATKISVNGWTVYKQTENN